MILSPKVTSNVLNFFVCATRILFTREATTRPQPAIIFTIKPTINHPTPFSQWYRIILRRHLLHQKTSQITMSLCRKGSQKQYCYHHPTSAPSELPASSALPAIKLSAPSELPASSALPAIKLIKMQPKLPASSALLEK